MSRSHRFRREPFREDTWSPAGQLIIYHSMSQLTEIGAHGGVPEQPTKLPGLNTLAKWGNILARQ